jgi:hypothetical protein
MGYLNCSRFCYRLLQPRIKHLEERSIKRSWHVAARKEETPWVSSRNRGTTNVDCYINGNCMRERIASDERLAETVRRERAGQSDGGAIWVSFDGGIQMDS